MFIDPPSERGKIRNREYAATLRDFTSLRWGKITPTDIDAFLDFKNKGFVFVESKFGNAWPPYGQGLAFERLVDAVSVPAIFIIARHDTPAEADIDVGASLVVQYRWNKKWRVPKAPLSVREATESFLAFLKVTPLP